MQVPALSITSQQKIWVAFSGGLDSRVLLDWVIAHHPTAHIQAIHINHNLSANASDWVLFCEKTCADYGIPLEVQSVKLSEKSAEGIEAEARALRYEVFARVMQSGDILCLAQHADDQAETVLLQLLRGAGPRGLSGMAERTDFADGEICRPFLHLRRESLVKYANDRALNWIEDESNQNRKFSRNFIRHEILPLLNQRWPEAVSTINRAAHWCQETEDLLQSEALRRLQNFPDYPNTLSCSALRAEEPRWQSLLFRQWLSHHGALMPSQKKCANILQSFLSAKIDAKPHEHWSEWHLHRYQDQLYLLTSAQIKPGFGDWPLLPDVPCELPANIGTLRGKMQKGAGIALDRLPGPLCVRFRQGGEPSLKKRLQEAGLPPWQRARVPLIYAGDELIAVVGVWVNAQYAAHDAELGWTPDLSR